MFLLDRLKIFSVIIILDAVNEIIVYFLDKQLDFIR